MTVAPAQADAVTAPREPAGERLVDPPGLSAVALTALLLVSPLSALAYAGLGPVLPQIGRHFADTTNAPALVRLLVSGIAGAMIVGAPLGGVLGDRFGKGRVLAVALLAYAVLGVAGSVLPSLGLLLASRLVFGVAAATAMVLPNAVVASRMPAASRDKWIGLLSTSGTVGGLVLIGLAGIVGQHGWRDVFLLHLVALAILPLVCMSLLREPAVAVPSPQIRGDALERQRFPFALIGLGIACGVVVLGPTVFLPFRLVEIGVTSPQKIAIALLPPTLTGTVAAFSYGWVRQRIGSRAIFAAGFIVSAAGLALAGLTTSYAVVIGAMLLFGAGMGYLAPNLFAAAGDMALGAGHARMMGYANTGFAAGPVLAQLALEPVIAATGPGTAVIALAVFSAIAAAGFALLARIGSGARHAR